MKPHINLEEIDLINDSWYGIYENGDQKVEIKSINQGLEVNSDTTTNNLFTYIYYKKTIEVKHFKTGQIIIEGSVEGSLQIEFKILGFNKNNSKIFDEYVSMEMSKNFEIPANVSYFKVALRVSGKGKGQVSKLKLNYINITNEQLTKNILEENTVGEYLILTNVYPEENNLYRNMFVHRRAQLYKEDGLGVDIFRFNKNSKNLSMYNFEGLPVAFGGKEHLKELLTIKKYKKVLIHFVTKDMIDTIRDSGVNPQLLIWIHGVETEKWYRRWFNFIDSSTQLQKALENIDKNQQVVNFMSELYQSKDLDIKFVFVSKWFKEAIAENDTHTRIENYEIIHNVVDEELFNYVEKDAEQRKKILSIRPYASKKYANDLTVKAILELSKKPYFNELEFTLYGEGPLFHSTLDPIKNFTNVKINNYFLSQNEIAAIHKNNGVFMCPTRLDSQGVSMCEAMSSGLIPVTNGVTAIPEFVDNECGYLGRKENYMDMVQAIEELYLNPEIFMSKSQNAAQRMNQQCGKNVVIRQELDLIRW